MAPRFLARLNLDGSPLGKPVWGDTWLGLPADRPGRRYENLLTGEIVEAVQWEGRPRLPAASVFTCFPVAFLIQERETR